jgi:creatinine amidohydrolase
VQLDLNKYRLELANPGRIQSALSNRSIIYIPLGAIEWHGLHLPIGLDGLTSHGLCLRAAHETGGLVMPALYYGMTGSIGHHPWTILLEKEETFIAMLNDTLRRLEAFEVKLAVIFTGHFGKRQIAALKEFRESWMSKKHSMKLLVLSVSECPQASMKGDHGAIFETSLLYCLHPELVNLNNLPDKDSHPANDPGGDSWGVHRRDPNNVLFGILGDDPRKWEKGRALELFETVQAWLIKESIHNYSVLGSEEKDKLDLS